MPYPLPPGWTWEQWAAAWLAAIRVQDLPDLGAVTDATSFVGELAGTGRFGAQALRNYVQNTGLVTATGGNTPRSLPDHFANMFSVKDRGAQGNGIADDTAAFQSALDTQRSIYVPKGSYRITAPLNMAVNGQRVYGEGGGAWATIIEWESDTGDCFNASGLQYCVVDGLHIRRPGALAPLTTGHAVKFGPLGTADAFRCAVRNCRIEGVGNGISLQGVECRVDNVDILNINGAYGVRFWGTDTRRSYRAIVSGLLCNNDAGGSDDTDWIVFDSYAYSLVLEKCALLNGRSAVVMKDSAAGGTSYPMWIFAWDIEADHNNGDAVTLQAGEGFQISGSWLGSSLGGNGLALTPGWRGDLAVTNTRIMGNWFHGIFLGGGFDATITNCLIGDNSQEGSGINHGIMVAENVGRFAIVGNRSGDLVGVAGNNQGYGVFIDTGTSDEYQIIGNILPGNVTGRIFDGGSGINKEVQAV